MDISSYRDQVTARLTDHDYETLSVADANPFEPVWYKKDEDPTIGVTRVYVTVIEDDDIDTDRIATTAEAFRTLLSSSAPSTAGSVENLFGYVVFAVDNPSESLIEFATEEYTVANRRTNVFPLLYDLSSGRLYTHTVPRLKGRGFYEKQKLDADALLTP